MSKKPPPIFDEIASLPTESINPRTLALDEASTEAILKMINHEDRLVAPAVAGEMEHIAAAVEMVVAAIKAGGRVFYVGAGTSGRLGVIDAAECPPTFGTPPDLFQGIIAGGYGAIIKAREGSEDREDLARRAMTRRGVRRKDIVVGLAACRRTPYVLSALERARAIGASTVYVTCNPGVTGDEADVVVAVDVGPEAVMGSTRMKCGTAEKLVLNMISTASMVRLGKVYGNMMVDLMANSEKLRQRSVRIIMLAAGCKYDEAAQVLKRAKGSVKVAIVMQIKGLGRKDAVALLKKSDGFVKKALKEGT
ncbi:N-acetylmuramic acid 6-phosphate etherase [Candidatus Eisenbacteria bacterium]|uniref:N-acetylmuramic acid 6-phosphate etherase n=1 Tax=Eiseniibacteriota bacterium TaxID=2212470 RepID=A0ABV6YNX3_UNCEI